MITVETIVTHILHMRTFDEDYARYALRAYNDLLPHLDLNAAIRAAMKAQA